MALKMKVVGSHGSVLYSRRQKYGEKKVLIFVS